MARGWQLRRRDLGRLLPVLALRLGPLRLARNDHVSDAPVPVLSPSCGGGGGCAGWLLVCACCASHCSNQPLGVCTMHTWHVCVKNDCQLGRLLRRHQRLHQRREVLLDLVRELLVRKLRTYGASSRGQTGSGRSTRGCRACSSSCSRWCWRGRGHSDAIRGHGKNESDEMRAGRIRRVVVMEVVPTVCSELVPSRSPWKSICAGNVKLASLVRVACMVINVLTLFLYGKRKYIHKLCIQLNWRPAVDGSEPSAHITQIKNKI